MLKIDNLHVNVDGRGILKGLSLDVKADELVVDQRKIPNDHSLGEPVG